MLDLDGGGSVCTNKYGNRWVSWNMQAMGIELPDCNPNINAVPLNPGLSFMSKWVGHLTPPGIPQLATPTGSNHLYLCSGTSKVTCCILRWSCKGIKGLWKSHGVDKDDHCGVAISGVYQQFILNLLSTPEKVASDLLVNNIPLDYPDKEAVCIPTAPEKLPDYLGRESTDGHFF